MKKNRLIQFMIRLEKRTVEWKARNGLNILRVSLGLVFIWFGVLKFFPGMSAAEAIAGKTIYKLSFGLVKPPVSLPLLAIWECTIGFGLVFNRWLNLTLLLLYFQMAGTFLPLFFFPHETFASSILIPTLLGQYIIKNIVLLSAGIVIGAAVKGGTLTAHPEEKWPLTKTSLYPVFEEN
ncbi:DoxX family membrane protein [Mucilaginibacter sp. SP1R1]|uniref:DoxX family membrane protein n=1 Tax=Mucilaginibacter sp. SP1R1 TaxID=2723091 RepID=UPI00161AFB22|nr:DoxX family membrane protein [Mucilaginibacter sp. SP1R1]MBB6151572.1 putative membrane protein YkgB [Mucilaginibacter sp. SP1R1]